MNTTTHDPIFELKDFVMHQAEEDAALPPAERRYQAELVKDVLGQELKPAKAKELVRDYSKRVTRHLSAKHLAA